MRHPKRLVVLLILFLVLIGLWSTQAMPGSVFYGYKTNINDPAFTLLNITRERRARYEVDLLEKRLAEITELLRDSKLTDGAYTAWERAFTEDMYTVTGRVGSMQTSESILLGHALATQQYAVLQAYATGLPMLQVSDKGDIGKVVDVLKPYLADTAKAVQQKRDSTMKLINKQQFLGKVEGQINEVVVYADETKARIPDVEADVTKDLFISLNEAQEKIDKQIFDAKEKRARDFYPEAGLEIQDAHAASRQLRILINIIEGI